ncbi:helix-turn-helix transcriptional regulator [Arthrobacter wenxiniae]|jgi:predicted ArsR family transcriptional regulator|uniref:Helix-turn-helix domain-containing protein n=1 Tax=Arthrobacter wenxiniae TaxID=2713570 RepID=A0A7Y7M051_9MICC|nr:helix-turn-helix domain-containing protein [Arthrobacter wenxiniae]NVM95664.1 helix-turn-helix domain-containing protein [Arthrobacter wenxiniae]
MKLQHRGKPDPAIGALGASRTRVLEVLQDAGTQLNVNDIAARVGLHTNTVRFHLDALVAAGLVASKAEERELPGRPRTLYAANANSDNAGSRSYLLLAEILASSMSTQTPEPREAAVKAGQEWGRYLGESPPPFKRVDAEEATERLVSAMDTLGFSPEKVTRGRQRQVLLHHCPFREVAKEYPEVTCSIHLGLMKGLLAELDAPLEVERLDPFVEPTLCVASLASLAPGTGD